MTEPLQVGQFAIVDRVPVDRGPNAGIFHGKGPSDDRAELFILAEGTTPAGEAFAGHIVSALGNAFGTLDMSLTGSLHRLFSEAQTNLADWNRKSIAQHRVSIGLTCFGRRGGQAVIAQAGPSAAFHLHNGKVESYFADEEHGRPIGAGTPVNPADPATALAATVPQLTRIPFDPGDRLLLISTVALQELDDELIHGIVKLPGEQVLPELFHRLQDVRHLTAVLVTGAKRSDEARDGDFVIDATAETPSGGPVLPANSSPEPSSSQPSDAGQGGPASALFQPSLFIDDRAEDTVRSARKQLLEITPRRQIDAIVPSVVLEMPTPLARVSGESALARMAADRKARAAIAQSAAMATLAQNALRNSAQSGYGSSSGMERPARPATNGYGDSASKAIVPRRRHERRDSFSRGLVHEEVPPRPDPAIEVLPLVDDLAEEHRARGSMVPIAAETIAGDASATLSSGGSLVRVRGDMGGRWKSGGFSRRTATNGSLPPTWLVILVGLGILLVLVGIITVPGLLSKQSSQRYAGLIDGAQQKIATAQVQTDPASKRAALTGAQALLLEARDSKDAGPDSATLLTQVNAQLAAMDAVRAPAAVSTLGSLQQFGEKAVSATRLAVGPTNGYILDNASGGVIAMPLAGGDAKVIFQGATGQKEARPIAMSYLDSGDPATAGLLIADASENLWSYAPATGLHQLAFAIPANARITDITTDGHNLYVLDAAQSVVYRFTPSDNGYSAAPTTVLNTPDLAAARRLTFDSDEIITSDANGAVHRFSGAVSMLLSESGIDKLLTTPEAAQSIGTNGDLAFLDAPNDRIVVIHRDGTFSEQYQDKNFESSSEFTIRDGAGYIFSNGMLRKITF
ncbi:MAG TPA: hypothetical protein VN697_09470 [Tepidiformaceae bacterium]|nr:hypothetical protein [Tepidiformaceae bacterium]